MASGTVRVRDPPSALIGSSDHKNGDVRRQRNVDGRYSIGPRLFVPAALGGGRRMSLNDASDAAAEALA